MQTAIESSVYVSSPEFAGYLTKRGFHWRKLWKKKWVALHGSEIVYMDEEPTSKNAGSMSITKAQITASTEIVSEDLEGNVSGFAIQINDGHSPTWYLRAENERQKKQWVLRLSYIHAIMRWLGDFEKVRVLGVGGTGIVYELLHCSNGTRYAMKEMDIKNGHQMTMAVSEAEMLKDIMEHVSHPNIMHIEKVFQVGSKFYLVFPLCTGGELYEHIIKRGHFTEHDAALLMRDLISGLDALHAHDILHLDIKPENILFESMADDAKIKITDFGLSKIFQTDSEETPANIQRDSVSPSRTASRRFSMELMGNKMKAFLDNNQLNIDRLKGTVGYMSPELILTGHCSKATDVFAAGVVLYILLCGRPPFNSKSNREVLERTVKGAYKMSGHEWSEISDEAKDLVRKMLTTNPEQRITTGEILKHPWLTQLDVPVPPDVASTPTKLTGLINSPAVSAHKAANTTNIESIASPKKLSTNVNLSGALRLLSGHVKHLQSEKFATSVTRLVSHMQQGGSAAKGNMESLSNKYLVLADSSAGKEGGDGVRRGEVTLSDSVTAEDLRLRDDQDIMMLMNSDLKSALTAAIDHLGIIESSVNEDGSSTAGYSGGKLTLEQFMVILKHFQFTPAGSGGRGDNKASIGALLFCRFLDRDGDGYISIDDISTAQALIMQRNDLFLKMIFRVFIEALWYPGRNMNVMNVIQTTPMRGRAENGESNSHNLSPNNSEKSAGNSSSAQVTPAKSKVMTENNMPIDVVEPPKFITGRHVAAVFEKLGYDPAAGQKVFTVLCEAISRMKASEASSSSGYLAKMSEGFNDGTDITSRQSLGSHPSQSGSDSDSPHNSINNGVPSSAPTPSAASSTNVIQKMDYADFVRAVEIDDVFLQAIFRKPRSKIISVVRRASGTFKPSSSGSHSGGNVANTTALNQAVSGTEGAQEDEGSGKPSASVIENELKEAFKSLKVQQDNQNKSVFQKGFGSLTAAFGKITTSAAALFDYDDSAEQRETNADLDDSSRETFYR